MRRAISALTVFVTVALSPHPAAADALGIGPPQLPNINVPVGLSAQSTPIVAKPDWLPEVAEEDTVIVVPGSGDFDGSDQLARTRDIGFYPNNPSIAVVEYPAAFGFRVLGIPIDLLGRGTVNDSVAVGTEKTVLAAHQAYDPQDPHTVVLSGYSQSGPVTLNAAYLLHRDRAIPDEDIVVIVGADSRFPITGVENVVPSFIDGILTNGDRDPADTGDIEVISYCVRGDATCGVGNPLARPVSTAFYVVPGFYVHAFLNDRVNEYAVTKTWKSETGNTTYVVLDGGNPWGMMLRDLGVPVPREFDEALSAVVPVPMPGERATIAGSPVPTPRELQERVYNAMGRDVPASDPDVLDRRQGTSPTTASVEPAETPVSAVSSRPIDRAGLAATRRAMAASDRPPRTLRNALRQHSGAPLMRRGLGLRAINRIAKTLNRSHDSTVQAAKTQPDGGAAGGAAGDATENRQQEQP